MYDTFDWKQLSDRHRELLAEAEEWRRAREATPRGGAIARLMGRLGFRRGVR